jgi:uncharacterized membrane protein YqgA involved in biofilm formation
MDRDLFVLIQINLDCDPQAQPKTATPKTQLDRWTMPRARPTFGAAVPLHCQTKPVACAERTPIMNTTLIIAFIVLATILVGAFIGVTLRDRLPKHHLTDETKNLVNVSTAVVATVSALVLGLLISNANTSFTRLGGQVTALSAEILRLDQMLRRYGADAEPARKTLLQYAEHKADDLFPDNPADVRLSNPATYELLQRLEDMLLALKPANPRDQWWLAQAMTLAAKIGETRWLIAQQIGQGTPKAFVALLVFWLALLFASFGLFAPPNLTSAITLTLCALAVAGAVGMILELEQGFGGLVRISPEPMRQAVSTLETEPSNQNAP